MVSRDSPGKAADPGAMTDPAATQVSARFDRAILYFGNDWDAENRTSSHQVALQLNKLAEIVYIECPGLRRPAATARDARKLVNKLRKVLQGPRSANGLHVYTLLQLPFHGSASLRWLNRRLVNWQVRRIRRNLGSRKPPVLWFVIPHVSYLPRLQRDCPSVYYCIDKYAALPGVDARAVDAMDQTLTETADLLFVASEKLFEDKRRQRPDTILSPHGVDFDLFSQAADRQGGARPADLPPWPGPIVGFFGSLESWIDLQLLAHVAQRRPDWLIVLIGHEAVDVGPLRNHSNVLRVGCKPFAQLPRYGRFFDVGLLPYKLTEQVIHSNPIKLREYLAMGKPVVSVRFPHAEGFGQLVYLAGTYDEFVSAIERALREDDDALRRARMESVRNTTWAARASTALQHLRTL
jgi:glycosyltransferase involved in cell wall biosynthesis